MAMKKPKVEQGEEAKTLSTQIPDDKEGLIDFMDQRANSIEALKDQLSNLERKVSLLSFCDEFSSRAPSRGFN